MPTDYDNRLLKEGIINLKAGELGLARKYLQRALQTADDSRTRAQASFYLGELAENAQEKRKLLEDCLAFDPLNSEARRKLAILDGKLKPEEIIDPDNFSETRLETPTADRFACPQCGGRMVYTPDGTTLTCEYCQGRQTLQSETLNTEQDFYLAMAIGKGHRKPVAVNILSCLGCGAEFLLEEREMTAECSFCGSTHVLQQRRELATPDSVIPMALNQRQAAGCLANWMEANKIEPENKEQTWRGLYLPVWTFDIFGDIPWSGRTLRKGQEVLVSDRLSLRFDDIIIPASQQLPGLFEKLLPEYDYSTAVAYDPRYLAGWLAEVYEIAMSDASLEARRIAVEKVRQAVQAECGHVFDLQYSSSSIAVESFKLLFLPVWITTYTIEEKSYRVVINGVTGAVHGETPSGGLLDWLGDILGK